MSFLPPQRRVLSQGEGRRIVLTWYPPMHTMADHAHDADQRSVLLAGSLQERAGSRMGELIAGVTGYKAAGVKHANLYGPNGALILALDGPAPQAVRSRGDWLWRGGQALNPIRRILGATLGGSVCTADAAEDLEALVEPAALDDESALPPPWLIQVKDAIDDDPAGARVYALAQSVGVHRVHLSRSFASSFGMPISLYRRRAMTAKGVRSLLQNQECAGVAAADAGVADQSHFTRALKAETGLTPCRLAAALS